MNQDDTGWIGIAINGARAKAVAALYRYFRDLDLAEEAFQEASLRALTAWPKNGPPRDAAAWLIFVGRNTGIDVLRKRARHTALPDEAVLSDTEDAESAIADRLDESHYRDDILRLLFVCCHPELPATGQIALALRVVSGLSVKQIARAFLVSEAAMEQRITRAKGRIAKAGVAFDTPDATERAERLGAVAAMVYLVFNEGYSSASERGENAKPFCEEAIRLGRLLLGLFPAEPELMGLLALMLLQGSRESARFDADGHIILMEDQDRDLWDRTMITEGLSLVEKAMRHGRPGPFQIQAAIAALHAEAKRAADTDWVQIELLYRALERMQPSPVVTLNRAVALSKVKGPQAALDLIDPLEEALSGYFYFHGLRGGLLMELKRDKEAREAFDKAMARATTTAEATHIRLHIDKLEARGRSGRFVYP
ncbi:RNA polymerase sigma factor [Pelagibacterium xiamenense]|uniref:RNA polymerase sigma factor n=1 Tax=Pelagibacterium xiamenense TaxID=2901140 RepID=UPI001E42299D|nr:RNA polymerase sigma factor [Pelagibacterium xiamenense]MCD7059534.1 RNA polymerase sigma factor [Pelagibacterium xiamenense]